MTLSIKIFTVDVVMTRRAITEHYALINDEHIHATSYMFVKGFQNTFIKILDSLLPSITVHLYPVGSLTASVQFCSFMYQTHSIILSRTRLSTFYRH